MTVPCVLIVYQHLPHYRHGVFSQLELSPTIEYEFAADSRSRDGSIPTLPPTSLRRFHRLTNHWLGPFLWQSGLVKLLLRQRYSAVIFLGDVAYLSTWVGAAVCRIKGSLVLFWTIGWHRPEHGLRKWTRIAFYRIAEGLMLYGHTGKRIGENLGYPADRMTVVGNSQGSHLNGRHPPTAAELEKLASCLPPNHHEVLTAVVRMNPGKKLDLLVRAAAHLNSQGRPVIVLLVGSGPVRENLCRLARHLGVDLRLTGPVYSDAGLRLIYERTTLTVVPVYAGLTSLQSLSHGRPVITSDDEYNQAPESECVRSGYTGEFYADGSVDSLAATIATWLDRMKIDGEAVAKKCRQEIDMRWSPQAHAAAISAEVTRRLTKGAG